MKPHRRTMRLDHACRQLVDDRANVERAHLGSDPVELKANGWGGSIGELGMPSADVAHGVDEHAAQTIFGRAGTSSIAP
jgi:hypothetical protein